MIEYKIDPPVERCGRVGEQGVVSPREAAGEGVGVEFCPGVGEPGGGNQLVGIGSVALQGIGVEIADQDDRLALAGPLSSSSTCAA